MATLASARQACYDLATFGDNVIAFTHSSKKGVEECRETLYGINDGVNQVSMQAADNALQEASVALGRATVAIESMQRAIKGFINDKLEQV